MVFTVFRLLTDFVCLYTYEFLLSLCKIVRSSVILLLPLKSKCDLFSPWYSWIYCSTSAAYRITAVLKVETDSIASNAASPTGYDTCYYVCLDRQNWCYCFYRGPQTSHWPIIVNIRVSSCACGLRNHLLCLWIKVSSVIQTVSAPHIKEKMSNWPIKTNH